MNLVCVQALFLPECEFGSVFSSAVYFFPHSLGKYFCSIYYGPYRILQNKVIDTHPRKFFFFLTMNG